MTLARHAYNVASQGMPVQSLFPASHFVQNCCRQEPVLCLAQWSRLSYGMQAAGLLMQTARHAAEDLLNNTALLQQLKDARYDVFLRDVTGAFLPTA